MTSTLQELRYVLRTLRKHLGFTIVAVLTLAVGIGASTSIFSILDGSVLRPLPYPQPDRMVQVRGRYVPTGGGGPMSVPNYLDLRRDVQNAQILVGYESRAVNFATEDAPLRASALSVTANFFDGLGMSPAQGRGFLPGEDREGAAKTVVITDRLWHDRFGGRADIIGQTTLLNGEPYTIVGVLPPTFWFPGDPDLVMPLAWTQHDMTETRGSRHLEMFARLAPGVTAAAAEAEFQRLFAEIAATYPEQNNRDWTIVTSSVDDWMLGVNRSSLWLLSGAVLLVLVIGCVNVANLLLVRAERRHREMAVRAAIGAGRGDLMKTLVVESLSLAALGSVVGIGLAWASTRGLLALFGSSLPRANEVGLDLRVLGFAAILALLTGLAVGLVPAFRINPERLQQGLREGAHGTTGSRSKLLSSLVVAEVALAVLLVAGAGLMLKSFWHLNRVETGIDPTHAFTFQVQLPETTYPESEDAKAFFDRAAEGVAAVPGVEHVGLTDRIPLRGGFNITTLASPVDPAIEAKFVEIRTVTPDFFAATGIPLLQGRMFTEADARDSADVVLISDELAHTLFPDGDPVGQWINPGFNDDGYQVVGVVGGVREWGVTRDRRPAVYWPFGLATGVGRTKVFIVRTASVNPLAVLPAVRNVMTTLDRTVPIYGVSTMEDVVHRTFGTRSFATTLFSAFGALALSLAAIGIFSVLAFTVEQRRREVGIRMALGATRANVTRLVVRGGLALTGVGLLIGVGAALFASRLLSDLLYDVRPADPVTLVAVTAVALVAAAAASFLPARRAAAIEPMQVVREE